VENGLVLFLLNGAEILHAAHVVHPVHETVTRAAPIILSRLTMPAP
jgi:hypothetical protein